jgi:hypothetical protein
MTERLELMVPGPPVLKREVEPRLPLAQQLRSRQAQLVVDGELVEIAGQVLPGFEQRPRQAKGAAPVALADGWAWLVVVPVSVRLPEVELAG